MHVQDSSSNSKLASPTECLEENSKQLRGTHADDLDVFGFLHALGFGVFALCLWRLSQTSSPDIIYNLVKGGIALATVTFAVWFKIIHLEHCQSVVKGITSDSFRC